MLSPPGRQAAWRCNPRRPNPRQQKDPGNPSCFGMSAELAWYYAQLKPIYEYEQERARTLARIDHLQAQAQALLSTPSPSPSPCSHPMTDDGLTLGLIGFAGTALLLFFMTLALLALPIILGSIVHSGLLDLGKGVLRFVQVLRKVGRAASRMTLFFWDLWLTLAAWTKTLVLRLTTIADGYILLQAMSVNLAYCHIMQTLLTLVQLTIAIHDTLCNGCLIFQSIYMLAGWIQIMQHADVSDPQVKGLDLDAEIYTSEERESIHSDESDSNSSSDESEVDNDGLHRLFMDLPFPRKTLEAGLCIFSDQEIYDFVMAMRDPSWRKDMNAQRFLHLVGIRAKAIQQAWDLGVEIQDAFNDLAKQYLEESRTCTPPEDLVTLFELRHLRVQMESRGRASDDPLGSMHSRTSSC